MLSDYLLRLDPEFSFRGAGSTRWVHYTTATPGRTRLDLATNWSSIALYYNYYYYYSLYVNNPEAPGSMSGAEVDYRQYPLAQKLLQRCQDFFAEVENLTPGKDLEAHLNANYGPGTPIYEDLCWLTRQGLDQGWVANIAIDGPRYRRSKISPPKEETRFFSITAVYVDSQQGEFSGQHHSHPYGEINCVVPIDKGTELKGMQGWQGAGWTSPGPGTHHYPQFRGGRLISLFFLPAGRISYAANPDDPQPAHV